MRQALISLVMVFWAGAAVAEDPALILGTDTYAEIGQLPNGTEPVAAADSLRELGFTVFHRTNVGINATNEALFEFTRRVPTPTGLWWCCRAGLSPMGHGLGTSHATARGPWPCRSMRSRCRLIQ